jgi:hypothetical protein
MEWLVGETNIFGLVVQNWLLIIGGSLALYIAGLVIAQRRQPRRMR